MNRSEQAAELLVMATAADARAARYQDGLTAGNADVVQPKIDQQTFRATCLRAGAAALTGEAG